MTHDGLHLLPRGPRRLSNGERSAHGRPWHTPRAFPRLDETQDQRREMTTGGQSRGVARCFTLSAVALLFLLLVVPAGHASSQGGRTAPLVQLPRDDAMHPSAGFEWWYIVGHLHDAQGHRYGYETVVFRLPRLKSQVPASHLDTVYRVDSAITDESGHSFSGGTRSFAAQPGQTLMSATALDIRVGAVRLARVRTTPRLTYDVRSTAPNGASLALSLQSTKPALLVGGTGFVAFGSYESTYYYSLTHLATTGVLRRPGGRQATPVSGISWMDHQWGVGTNAGTTGWAWMALQLANGMDLNLYELRTVTGATIRLNTISMPDGRQIVVHDSALSPLGHWRSSWSHTTYPAGWHVVVPGIKLAITVLPTVPDQEIRERFVPETSYWEGSCTVTGTLRGQAITGMAYTELVGYGARSAVQGGA